MKESKDRIALLVAAQVQAGMLEHTHWADLIYKAAKVERAIGLAAVKESASLAELDALIGERKR